MRIISMSRACLLAQLCATFSVFSCTSAFAEDKPSVESFFADPAIYQAEISPSGKHVAILLKAPEGGQMLAIRDTADLKNATVVAGAEGDDKIYRMHWVNENRIVYEVRAGRVDVEGGGEDVIAVDIDRKDLHHLISGNWHHNKEMTGSNIKSKILTYDYRFYSTLHDGSDDIVVLKLIWKITDPYHPDSTHLYRLNTKTMELSDIPVGKSPHSVRTWLSDAKDVPRIAWTREEGKCIVNYRASASAEWEVLNTSDCYAETFSPYIFDADQSLVVKASYKGYDALFHYDLKTRKLEKEPFLALDGFDFSGSIEVDNVVNKMMGIHLLTDARSSVWFNQKYKDIQAKVDKLLPQTSNQLSCGSDCLGASAVLVTSNSDRQPTQYFIYNLEKESLVGLGSTRPDIKSAQMGLRDFYRFKARDGVSIPVYVTVPPGKSDKPWPTIVLVHGGPWARSWTWEWENEAQFLASRGYMVVQPEFRGSTGFGNALFHAGWKQWGQSMQDDLADAAQWAVKEHNADPKRVGIMGASYGGYATLMGLIKNPEIFRCGVDWAGVTDSTLMYTLAESDFSDDTKNYDLKLLMGDKDADAAMFKQYSPLENAAKLKQPLFMAHGSDDVRVPIAQATAFHNAVSKTNSQVEWVVYNNEYHGWHLEKDNVDFWKRVEVFLDKNLKNVGNP